MATDYKYGLLTKSTPGIINDGAASKKVGRVRRSDRSAHGYYKGAEIQNIQSARVYVFGDDNQVEADEENVEFEMPEMRSRLKKGHMSINSYQEEQPEYFVREIADGETLQAIALKYACPVSELKRLNKLIKDQEFFALKVLKVPLRKYSVISQQLSIEAKDYKNWQHFRSTNETSVSSDTDPDQYNNYFEENDSQHDFSDPDTQIKIMRSLSIRDNFSSQGKDAEKFLKRMDDDLKKVKQSSRLERESLSEVISVLTNKSIHPLQTSRPSDKLTGATCGISWWSIILIILIVVIIVPVVLFLYIKYVFNYH